MIGGYILSAREPHIEREFKNYSTKPLVEFVIESNDDIGWFFHNLDRYQSFHNIYHSNSNLLMIGGVAVTGNQREGYRLIEPSRDFSQDSNITLLQFLNRIVSNITVILVSHSRSGLTVEFASHRASGGRVWYIKIPGKGVLLCDDLRALLCFRRFEIEPKAIYGILKYGASPDPINVIKGVYSVPASHFATCKTPDFNIKTSPFFKFDFSEADNCNIEPTKDILMKTAQFLNSQAHLLLLSGGVDSTLLAHYLDSKGKTEAFFLSFGKNDTQLAYAKEAAKKANVNLNTVYMEGNDVLSSIKGTAVSYMYPFCDDSIIPTFFLMNHIIKLNQNRSVLIDGTGADAAFGFDTIAYRLLWKILYAQPMFMKQIGRALYDNGGIYKYTSKWQFLSMIIHFFSIIAKTCETDIQLSPLVLSPIESFFTKYPRDCEQDVSQMFLNNFSSCTYAESYNNSFRARATVGEFLHICSYASLKTYRIGSDPSIDVVYPYLWRDILVEQGRLSWRIKQKGRIVKWPLKKLLEEYMTARFIYRKKSGLVPPLLNWLLQQDVYSFLHDVLLNPRAFIYDLITVEKVRNLLHELHVHRSASLPALFFLWSALFSELWLEENYHRSSNKDIESIIL